MRTARAGSLTLAVGLLLVGAVGLGSIGSVVADDGEPPDAGDALERFLGSLPAEPDADDVASARAELAKLAAAGDAEKTARAQVAFDRMVERARTAERVRVGLLVVEVRRALEARAWGRARGLVDAAGPALPSGPLAATVASWSLWLDEIDAVRSVAWKNLDLAGELGFKSGGRGIVGRFLRTEGEHCVFEIIEDGADDGGESKGGSASGGEFLVLRDDVIAQASPRLLITLYDLEPDDDPARAARARLVLWALLDRHSKQAREALAIARKEDADLTGLGPLIDELDGRPAPPSPRIATPPGGDAAGPVVLPTTPLGVLEGAKAAVSCLGFTPDGGRLVAGSLDRVARVWRLPAGERPAEPLAELRGHADRIELLAVSPDGRVVATAGPDQRVRLWEIPAAVEAAPSELTNIRVSDGPAGAIAWRPGERVLAIGGEKGEVALWSLRAGERKKLGLIRHKGGGRITALAWSADGVRLLVGTEVGESSIWKTPVRRRLASFAGHRGAVIAAAWHPDGERVVTAGIDGTAVLRPADGASRGEAIAAHRGPIRAVAWSPDGALLATASDAGHILLSTADGVGSPKVLRGHRAPVSSVAWAPDGRWLVTGGDDGAARLWEAPSGRELFALPNEEGRPVATIALSADGGLLAVADDRGVVSLYGRKP